MKSRQESCVMCDRTSTACTVPHLIPRKSFILCSGLFINFSTTTFRNILVSAIGFITNKTSCRNWPLYYSDTVLEGSLARMTMGSPWKILVLAAVASFFSAICVSSNSEGDALHAFRRSLLDPDNVLQSWDPTLVNPCTWFHVTCDRNNRVIRVDLGNSNLSGRLVPELGMLEHLQYLELYKNNITGNILEELGNLKNLISLDLYSNNLNGEIPQSLGNLKSLVFLRLNNNRLTGQIPRELTSLPNLKVLDISSNDLCGTIPIPTFGAFPRFPLNNFENNPRLKGPELQGLVSYDKGC